MTRDTLLKDATRAVSRMAYVLVRAARRRESLRHSRAGSTGRPPQPLPRSLFLAPCAPPAARRRPLTPTLVAAAAAGLAVALRVGRRAVPVWAACMLSYAAPVVSATLPAVFPTTGSRPAAAVTLLGANFRAVPGAGRGRAATLGPYACGPVQWTSDSAMACLAPGPGSGSRIAAVVTVGGLVGGGGFCYVAPSVTAVTRVSGPGTPGPDCGGEGPGVNTDGGRLPTKVACCKPALKLWPLLSRRGIQSGTTAAP
jgi:hypothetical protein